MTDLRKAAEMALEDICGAKLCELNSMSSRAEMLRLMDKAASALRQVLAQPEEWKNCRHCGFQYRPPKADKWHPLAQPEQEPVAHLWECIGRWTAMIAHDGEDANLAPPDWLVDAVKVATAPPKREWVGLTDDEILDAADSFGSFQYGDAQGHKRLDFAKAIEAKLKEKNA